MLQVYTIRDSVGGKTSDLFQVSGTSPPSDQSTTIFDAEVSSSEKEVSISLPKLTDVTKSGNRTPKPMSRNPQTATCNRLTGSDQKRNPEVLVGRCKMRCGKVSSSP